MVKNTNTLEVTSDNNERRPSAVSIKLNDEDHIVSPSAEVTPRSSLQGGEGEEHLHEEELTEKNTFLEVDNNKGYKTLSIFRCYTSPVYRRLVSGVSSSKLGESASNLDLDSLEEENAPTPPVDVEDKKEKSPENAKKKFADKKKEKEPKFKADVAPFGKFEKYDLKPLNTGNRRSSIEAPAPLDEFLQLPAKSASMHNGSVCNSDFKSAMGSPQNNPENGNDPQPLTLPPRSDTQSKGKILVTEEHGGVPEELCTTLMVRNIPNKYSQRMLQDVFTNFGFDNTFDFLYVPADFFHRLNLGYCFINFKKPEFAQQFAHIFQGYHLPAFKSKKKIQISLANTQGFLPNIEKLEHTALCSQFVSPEFHPICVDPETGLERPFLSFFPGYKPPPASRLEDPAAWAEHDAKWVRNWEGSLYPPVWVNDNDGTTKNKIPSNSPAATPPNGGGRGGGRGRNNNHHRNRGSYM